MKNIFYTVLIIACFVISSCKDFEDAIRRKQASNASLSCSEASTSASGNSAQDIKITSCASENNTVVFGQTYQHQLTTDGTYPGELTYSVENQPSGMTISPSGLVQWTPGKASDIKTHYNISVNVTTEKGYVLTQTYDLTVTGTCVSGNVLSIWTGDQRTAIDASAWLGNVTAYTDSSSNPKTADENYNYYSSSVHLTHGPTPTATTGNVFFYNQYNDTTNMYLFWMFGVKGNSQANSVNLDVFTDGNTSTDSVVRSDDGTETVKQSSGCGSSDACYTGRYSYNGNNSDGGVIGPFTGDSFRIFVDKGGTSTINGSTSLTVGGLDSFKYYSKDGSSFALGNVDNFTIGYSGILDCSN